MEEFKIYSVSDAYIDYLRQYEPNVYSNKVGNRTHTRKFVGTVIKINGYKYFVPMSSPKESDYQVAGAEKVIKKMNLIITTKPWFSQRQFSFVRTLPKYGIMLH